MIWIQSQGPSLAMQMLWKSLTAQKGFVRSFQWNTLEGTARQTRAWGHNLFFSLFFPPRSPHCAGLSQGSSRVALAWPEGTSGTNKFILRESKWLSDARCKPTAVLYYSNSAFLFNSSLHLLFPFPKARVIYSRQGVAVTNTFAFPLLAQLAILSGTKAQISPFGSHG